MTSRSRRGLSPSVPVQQQQQHRLPVTGGSRFCVGIVPPSLSHSSIAIRRPEAPIIFTSAGLLEFQDFRVTEKRRRAVGMPVCECRISRQRHLSSPPQESEGQGAEYCTEQASGKDGTEDTADQRTDCQPHAAADHPAEHAPYGVHVHDDRRAEESMNPAYLDLDPHGTEKEKHRGTLRRMVLTLVSSEAQGFRSTRVRTLGTHTTPVVSKGGPSNGAG